MKKPRRIKRLILGEGYPWYSGERGRAPYTKIGLVDRRNGGPGSRSVFLRYAGRIGAWQKIRLVAEFVPSRKKR